MVAYLRYPVVSQVGHRLTRGVHAAQEGEDTGDEPCKGMGLQDLFCSGLGQATAFSVPKVSK